MATPEELQRLKTALLMRVAQQGGDLTAYQTNLQPRQSMRPELDRTASIISEEPQLQEQLARAGGPADLSGIRVRPSESPAATSERERWSGLPLADRVGEINRTLAAQRAPAQTAPAPQPMAKTANGVSALTMGGAAPPPTTTVQVGRPAQVDVPRTAVMRSFGRPPSGDITMSTPAPVGGDVRQALSQSTGRVAELEEALRQRSGRELLATLLRAGGTAIGRGRGPAYDAFDAAAGQPLQDLALRQQAQEAERARALSLGDDDPSSQQSQMARSLLTQVLPGLDQTPGFERMSYARLAQGPMGGLVKMVMESGLSAQAAAARAAEKEEMMDFRREEAAGRREDRAAQRDLTRMLGVMGLQDRQDRRAQERVQLASKDASAFSELSDALKEARGILASKEPEGIGIGSASLARRGLGSSQGIKNQQTLAKLNNVLTRLRSGQAVTVHEQERLNIEAGLSEFATPERARLGLESMVKVLERAAADTRAKYPEETWETIRARGGTVPPTQAEFGMATPSRLTEAQRQRQAELRRKAAAR